MSMSGTARASKFEGAGKRRLRPSPDSGTAAMPLERRMASRQPVRPIEAAAAA
jgi:hypothetical protein